tara:strand:+ start:820 stop:1677 length:858 start_codon:yes stop_codon:yes gene_type:complete
MPERLLLCTDLDRTLIPNGVPPESPAARHHFALLAQHPQVVLAYVSGRHRELVQQAIEEYQLPQPQFVIGDVGTTIYAVDTRGRWSVLPTWEQRIAEDWQPLSHDDLRRKLDVFKELELQEPAKQNRHKISFYVPLAADREQLRDAVGAVLSAQGIRARQVWSIDDATGVGLLDIVPLGASKYLAIRALQVSENYTDADTVFSGDSGNDMDVLISPLPAILVANSAATVQREALERAAAAGCGETLYLARGGFMGMNGNYSAGILEGVAHYHPAIIDWMGFERAG